MLLLYSSYHSLQATKKTLYDYMCVYMHVCMLVLACMYCHANVSSIMSLCVGMCVCVCVLVHMGGRAYTQRCTTSRIHWRERDVYIHSCICGSLPPLYSCCSFTTPHPASTGLKTATNGPAENKRWPSATRIGPLTPNMDLIDE